MFPDIPNILERIMPGDIVPHGECPNCKALVSLKDEGPFVSCDICGDDVSIDNMRQHLALHNPNACNMDWKEVREMFTR